MTKESIFNKISDVLIVSAFRNVFQKEDAVKYFCRMATIFTLLYLMLVLCCILMLSCVLITLKLAN